MNVSDRCRRTALTGSAIAVGLGLLTLIGWTMGIEALASVLNMTLQEHENLAGDLSLDQRRRPSSQADSTTQRQDLLALPRRQSVEERHPSHLGPILLERAPLCGIRGGP